MKTRLIMYALLFSIFQVVAVSNSTGTFAQELGDPNIRAFHAQEISRTEYGFVLVIIRDDISRGKIYIPNSWFRPAIKNSENATSIQARTLYSRLGIEKKPIMKVTYLDNEVSSIQLILPNRYLNNESIPRYNTETNNVPYADLAAKFAAQENSKLLIIE